MRRIYAQPATVAAGAECVLAPEAREVHNYGVSLPCLPRLPELRRALLVAVSTTSLLGCVASLDELVRAEDAIVDDRILGQWSSDDGTQYVVTRVDSGHYRIRTVDDRGLLGRYKARIGRLGGRQVIDVLGEPVESQRAGDPDLALLIPAHTLIAIRFDGDDLWLAAIDKDSLRAAVERRALLLAGREAGDYFVLTDSTGALRAALDIYLRRDDVLEKWAPLHRRVLPRPEMPR